MSSLKEDTFRKPLYFFICNLQLISSKYSTSIKTNIWTSTYLVHRSQLPLSHFENVLRSQPPSLVISNLHLRLILEILAASLLWAV